MENVSVDPVSFDRLLPVLAPGRPEELMAAVARGEELLRGRMQWNVNATATGGGVAEMLRGLLAYTSGRAGRQTGWLVLDGTPDFFALTKRIHNLLHGAEDADATLSAREREVYEENLARNAAALSEFVRPGDVVVLHDPQTAGLVDAVKDLGAHALWRCHVGRDTDNDQTDAAWQFLRPYLAHADAFVFSREVYAPAWVDRDRLSIIAPAIDPFTAKNCELTDAQVRGALRAAGLVDFPDAGEPASFDRSDGSLGSVRTHRGLIHGGQTVPADAKLVLQVSRWDRLKDMTGVLTAFARNIDLMPDDAHLMLVGPDVRGVSDDPEGGQVLRECHELWESQPPHVRGRVHLCTLPMDDTEENGHLINALQRHAAVVVQKSLVEGFGLTVTEAMWKGRPVVASGIGGIQDQIVDGAEGILLEDPYDLDACARAVARLLAEPEVARALGSAAKERVRRDFLGDRYMIQYVHLMSSLLGVPDQCGARDAASVSNTP